MKMSAYVSHVRLRGTNIWASFAAALKADLASRAEAVPAVAFMSRLWAIRFFVPLDAGHLSLRRQYIASAIDVTRNVFPGFPNRIRTGSSKRCLPMATTHKKAHSPQGDGSMSSSVNPYRVPRPAARYWFDPLITADVPLGSPVPSHEGRSGCRSEGSRFLEPFQGLDRVEGFSRPRLQSQLRSPSSRSLLWRCARTPIGAVCSCPSENKRQDHRSPNCRRRVMSTCRADGLIADAGSHQRCSSQTGARRQASRCGCQQSPDDGRKMSQISFWTLPHSQIA